MKGCAYNYSDRLTGMSYYLSTLLNSCTQICLYIHIIKAGCVSIVEIYLANPFFFF